MATTSSERGLTLRSPGRFLAAADRLVDLWPRATAQTADPRAARRRGRARTSTPRRTAGRRFLTVTRMTDGESVGAESSLTKVFWSELDVRLHETALALLGPDAERRRQPAG